MSLLSNLIVYWKLNEKCGDALAAWGSVWKDSATYHLFYS